MLSFENRTPFYFPKFLNLFMSIVSYSTWGIMLWGNAKYFCVGWWRVAAGENNKIWRCRRKKNKIGEVKKVKITLKTG